MATIRSKAVRATVLDGPVTITTGDGQVFTLTVMSGAATVTVTRAWFGLGKRTLHVDPVGPVTFSAWLVTPEGFPVTLTDLRREGSN